MIKSIYKRWCVLSIPNLDKKELDYLIIYSYKVASSYLSHQNTRNNFLNSDQSVIEDQIISIIATLFQKDESGNTYLINSLNKFGNDVSDESDFEFYIIKIIWDRVDKIFSAGKNKCTKNYGGGE